MQEEQSLSSRVLFFKEEVVEDSAVQLTLKLEVKQTLFLSGCLFTQQLKMDKFKTVLNIAGKQTNLGFGLIALLTAGGEQIFSAVVFKCPCNELNFVYGIVFLLVPALALLLLGYILSKKTWKLLTGLCRRTDKLLCCKKLVAAGVVLCQIGTFALVAPSTWIAVALLNGNYYECAMTGTNVSIYNKHVCRDRNSEIQCEKELHRFPCGKSISVPQAAREDVLLNLRAESQVRKMLCCFHTHVKEFFRSVWVFYLQTISKLKVICSIEQLEMPTV